jgi:hypothetical protein
VIQTATVLGFSTETTAIEISSAKIVGASLIIVCITAASKASINFMFTHAKEMLMELML